MELDPREQQHLRGENVGHDYFPLHRCRFRAFGGSTNRWGGWSRPLQPTDFEVRPWIDGSGWPIDFHALTPYLPDTSRLLRTPAATADGPGWADRLPRAFDLEDTGFDNTAFFYSEPHVNFALDPGRAVLADPDVTTFVHATATQLRLSEDRVESVEITVNGRRAELVGRAVVLCGGGIENARLLLASDRDRPGGVGNEHDQVGRWFQEHVHVPCGHLVLAAGGTRPEFYRKAVYGDAKVRGVVTPRPELAREHRLLGCSIGPEDGQYSVGTPFLTWPGWLTLPVLRAGHRLNGRPPTRVGGRARVAVGLVGRAESKRRSLASARETARARRRIGLEPADPAQLVSLYFRGEQAPNPESRVTLGDRTDAFGVRRPRLDWRLTERDFGDIRTWLDVFGEATRSRGIGSVVPPREGWEERVEGGPHHLGTTRMSRDPRDGVTDADCRVHSVANLYVGGSSLFPIGGFANPTFTAVALALRLADHLQKSYA